MALPKHVHTVTSRGRTYFYYQEGRGTAAASDRVRLPDDPQSPEFWVRVREVQGLAASTPTDTVGAAIDAFMLNPKYLKVSKGTQDIYKRELKLARSAWGDLQAAGLKPKHVQAMLDKLADKPGKANNFLGAMRAFSRWAFAQDLLSCSVTHGLQSAEKEGGHKPWTAAQIECAHENLTGMVRRAVMLMLYTGQRGSDVVRLGPTFVDDGGFDLGQQKTGVRVWCPIVPELAAEMETWKRQPGPYLRQEDGRAYTRKRMSIHFREQTKGLPLLEEATLHGLRATAVVRLRREGLTTTQIQDIVGMSLAMIERYCRFADKKISGQAVLHRLQAPRGTNCKTAENVVKQKG